MSSPNFNSEASAAGSYPSKRFNQRERKLLQSIQDALPYSPIYAGTFTTAGGDDAETISVPGVLASDIVMVSLRVEGASPVTLDAAAPAADQINVTMSADPSTDHVLQYVVFRANS